MEIICINDIKKIFWETFKILEKNRVLEHVMLIGSWAEYIYEKSGYLKDFKYSLKTKDIDFLIKNINKCHKKNKAEKDYLSIEYLFENLKRSNIEFQKLKDLYGTLTKK